MKFNANT